MESNTMCKPVVSVIIPVYNGAKTIERAVKSVQQQTFSNLEILVIDNESTDETDTLIKAICKSDCRVRLLKSKKGRSNARNKGLTSLNGKYINFLDADDRLLDQHIERSVNYLEKNTKYFAYVEGFQYVNEENKVIPSTPSLEIDLNKSNPFAISSVLFKNDKNLTLFTNGLDHNEDWLFWYQNLINEKIKVENNIIGEQIFVTGNNTMSDLHNMLGSEIIVMSKMTYEFSLRKKIKLMFMFFQSKYIYQYECVNFVKTKFPYVYIFVTIALNIPLLNNLVKRLINYKIKTIGRNGLY